jgi:PIN domain nuclease of toxin-antitoxin system
MKLLLDTHTFLWFIEDNLSLSIKAKNLLESDRDLFISIASLWEISIKISLGKLTLTEPLKVFIVDQLKKNDIEILPIEIEHLVLVSALPFHHRDPFDRLLIAQSVIEEMPIVSIDSQFDLYSVKRLW